ncbi:unnamed protein product, partial [Didymodactylos carnosus]
IKHCSANNTPSVSPCSSPTVPKKEMTFTKLTNYVVKTDHHSHHHRNSTQDNSLTDQQYPYSIAPYVSPTTNTTSSSASTSSNIINNGTTTNHSYHSHSHHQRITNR